NVTGVPALTRTRDGLRPKSSAQSIFLLADAIVNVLTVPSWRDVVSSTRPVHSRVTGGGFGASRAGRVPPTLNAQTARLLTSATNCSPRLSYVIAAAAL